MNNFVKLSRADMKKISGDGPPPCKTNEGCTAYFGRDPGGFYFSGICGDPPQHAGEPCSCYDPENPGIQTFIPECLDGGID